jgi:hypothetical protein
MFLDSQISIYSSVKDTAGHAGTVQEFLQIGFSLREQIDNLRTKSGEERAQLKKMLPAATLSGVFSTRNKQGLIKHSGLIGIDIDNITNCSALLTKLSQIDIIAYASRSVSGQGVFAIVPIAYPEKHLQQWRALQIFFQQHNITLDKSCSDVSRLRICSYDNEAFVRTNAVAFDGVITEPKAKVQRHYSCNSSGDIENRVARCCNEIATFHIDLTQSYDEWLKIGFSLADGLGESGRQYFHTISSVNPGYSTNECNRKFSECLRSVNRCGIGYFFNRCKDFGVLTTTSRKF